MIRAMNHRLSSLRSRYTDAGPEGPHPQPRTLDSHSEGVKPISGIVRPLSQRVLPDCACVCPLGPRSRAPGGEASSALRVAPRGSEGAALVRPMGCWWRSPAPKFAEFGTCLFASGLRGTSRRNRPSVVPPRNTLARPNKACTSGGDQAWHPDEDESPIEASAQCPIRGVRRLTGAGADREAITESARP
jgi:hypothetical protein